VRFALRIRKCAIAFGVLAVSAISAEPAFADSAFVTQADKGAFVGRSLISSPVTGQPPVPSFTSPRSGTTQVTPETTVPATGGNFASTLEMGRNNFVFQSQSGSGNTSNVGILGGTHDNVGVFQKGQGLMSDLVLAGVRGLSVDVIQPPGTPPVNVLIARMPNGTVDLLQPKGAPPVSVFHVGNVLVIK